MALPTQANVNSAVQAVVKTYNNEVCDAGSDTKGECTAPVVKYFQKLGFPVPPMANDRADGWGTNFPSELAPHVMHEAFKPGTKYPEGTVIMFNSPHICFTTQETTGGNTAEVFEQNADPDGSKCHTFNRTLDLPPYHMATWVLIPKVASAPAATLITVKSGDTISGYMAKYGSTRAQLKSWNESKYPEWDKNNSGFIQAGWSGVRVK